MIFRLEANLVKRYKFFVERRELENGVCVGSETIEVSEPEFLRIQRDWEEYEEEDLDLLLWTEAA